MKIGANFIGHGKCEFVVWAPHINDLQVKILSSGQIVPTKKNSKGYWQGVTVGIESDSQYVLQSENFDRRPDPCSKFQPHGVHGPSQIVDHSHFVWSDQNWKGIPLEKWIIYELHTGTFSPQGNFDGIISKLDVLKDLGVNVIEILPIAQFPGERNWGYDGVFPFAVQNSYGGPDGLKKLVNTCHQKEFSVVLDVVYNHFGPEGNYFWGLGPYFTAKYKSPWGDAMNFDDEHNEEVRNLFIENALHWLRDYHIDGLRLDAVHAIYDKSSQPFLAQLSDAVENFSKEKGRKFYLIGESDLNDPRIILPREKDGYGLDGQWMDDFHHAVHSVLTGESSGYYMDFGKMEHMAKSLSEGFVYSGQFSPYRKKEYGASSKEILASQFVVCIQNHDQIGNRMLADRLAHSLPTEALKLSAGILLFSPFVPMLYMGEEYGETNPFNYFVSHADDPLIEAVRNGRREEFRHFAWGTEPPDPQDEDTFLKSKLDWNKLQQNKHQKIFSFYQHLIALRKKIPALSHLDKKTLEVKFDEEDKLLSLHRWYNENHIFIFFNFHSELKRMKLPFPKGEWKKILDSSAVKYENEFEIKEMTADKQHPELVQNAYSFTLYERSSG